MQPPPYQPGDKLLRIRQKLVDPTPALKQIGAVISAESQGAFKKQAFGGQKWEPRAPINVFGILADFAAGKKEPPARRFQDRPALRDTGRLGASIAWRIDGDAVVIGTNLDYASAHQFGGEVKSATITAAMQTAMAAWIKRKGRGKTEAAVARASMKRGLGWLLNKKFTGKQLVGKVPARPFVGITKQGARDIRKIIGVEILEVG